MFLAKLNKKERYIFLITIIISLFIIFSPYIFMGRKYLNTIDTINLHIPFYTEFRNKIYSGESIFWSHNFLFGSSFLSGKAFYLTTDIFSYIFLLFPFLEVVDALFVVQLIKSIVSYVGMYCFLDEFKFNFKSKIIGALTYTFSGWFFLFYGMPTFASFAALIPLFFLSIEHYLKYNKFIGVTVLTTILICSNFYFFYTLSFFLVFYWIARYFSFCDANTEISYFIKKTLFLIFIYILGVAISSPIMISTVYGMMQNSRIASNNITSIFWTPIKVYASMFVKFISSPVYFGKSMNTVLESNYYRLDQIGLFTTSCSCLFLPQYFVVCDKKHKIIGAIFVVVMMLFLFTQVGCSILHGFSEPSFRWTLFLTFVICLLLTYLLNNVNKFNFRLLLFTLLFYCVCIIFLICYFDMYNNAKIQFYFLSLSFILFMLFFFNRKNNLIYLLIVFEVVLYGFLGNYLWGDNNQNAYNYSFIPDNYFQSFNDTNEFYRVWISDEEVDLDYNKDFNYNSNLVLGYKGYYSYDSEYQASLTNLIRSYGQYFQWYGFTYDGIITATSGKYYIAKDKCFIPNSDIEFVEKIGNSEYSLFINKNYRKFGYTNNNVYSFEEWDMEDINTKDQHIKDYLIINSKDIKENNLDELSSCETHYISNLKYTNTSFDGDISTTCDELLFLSIPYDKGWKLFCDNEKLDIILTDSGFMSVLIPKGNHHINMRYTPYGLEIGIVAAIVSLFCVVFLNKKNKIK